MKLGITMFVTDLSCDVVTLAGEADARGFFSLDLPEHTRIPTNRASQTLTRNGWPGA